MELDFLNMLILSLLVSVVFWFLTRVKSLNEWYYVTKFRLSKHTLSLPLPPGDMGLPFIGNTSSLQALVSGDAENFMNNLVKRYGETGGIYKTHLLGKPSILVCAPETIKPVLLDEELFVPTYPTPMISYLRNNVFAKVTGSDHKRLCKLMTGPMNGHEALSMYIGNVKDIVIASLEEWVRVSKDRPIELFSEMRKAFFKVNLKIFLGSSRNSDYVFGSIEKCFGDFYNGFLVKGINIPGFAFHRAIKARNLLRKIVQKELDDRRTMEKRDQFQNAKKDLVDLMMEAEDESGKKLGDEDIVELVLVLLFGSYGSPPKAAAWATVYLHQHPHILQNVKEEQEEIVKKRPSTQKELSHKEIKQMPYLAKVIDETLRTVSLPPLLFREAKADSNIKGYIVPKGWNVFIWLRGVHLDSKIYSAPKEFDLARWENHRPKPGSFVPFGAGPRRCIGADVAKLDISTFLHYFLLNYKIEQVNPECPIGSAAQPNASDIFLAKVTKY